MSLRAFSHRINRIGLRVADNADRMVRRVAIAVDAAVVLATPVDTGRARANWQAGIGAAPAGVLPAPASPAGGAQRSIDETRATADMYRGQGAIHITNNLAYIGKLNEGTSAQAPAGFVEEAVNVGIAAVRGTRLLDP